MSKSIKILIGCVITFVVISLCIGGYFAVRASRTIKNNIETIKSKTNDSGIKTNALMLEGIIYSIIDDYAATEDGIKSLESKINDDINSVGKEYGLKNFITEKMGCIEKKNLASGGAVFYIDSVDNSEIEVDSTKYWPDELKEATGMVGYAAYINTTTGRVCVKIVPYDSQGNKMKELVKIIEQ